MKIIIENKKEQKLINKKKLSMIKEIIGKDFEIKLVINSKKTNKIEELSWEMGKKDYSSRDELYDR